MSTLSQHITRTLFRDECEHIITYMQQAFSGESVDAIRQVMITVLDMMQNDMRDNRYVMISDSAAIDERVALGDAIRSQHEGDMKATLAYADIACFNPEFVDTLNTLNQNTLWQRTRRQVANTMRENLPNLMPNGLEALLKDEGATIAPQPPFHGLLIETVGAFPFHKRVNPRNLRYDEQEQGNRWIDVVAGAIVCHYHTFIEIKQNAYLARALTDLTSRVKNNHDTAELADMTTWMSTVYAQAAQIHE